MNIYKTLFSIAALLFTLGTFGQPADAGEDQEMREKIEAMRISYITQQVGLTPEEAQKFWPVYNQYREEFEKAFTRRDRRKIHHLEGPDIEAMSDAEVAKMLEDDMARHRKMMELRETYYQKFKKVLPVKKVAKLYMAEGNFQRKLIVKMRDEKGERRYERH